MNNISKEEANKKNDNSAKCKFRTFLEKNGFLQNKFYPDIESQTDNNLKSLNLKEESIKLKSRGIKLLTTKKQSQIDRFFKYSNTNVSKSIKNNEKICKILSQDSSSSEKSEESAQIEKLILENKIFSELTPIDKIDKTDKTKHQKTNNRNSQKSEPKAKESNNTNNMLKSILEDITKNKQQKSVITEIRSTNTKGTETVVKTIDNKFSQFLNKINDSPNKEKTINKLVLGSEQWLKEVLQEKPNKKIKTDLKYISVINQIKSEMTISPKPYIKRYRKGKTKIYRIRPQKKKIIKSAHDFEMFYKKIIGDTQTNNISTVSSSSVPSSYKTDSSKSLNLSNGTSELSESQRKLRLSINSIIRRQNYICSDKKAQLKQNYKQEIVEKAHNLLEQIFEAFQEGKAPVFHFRKNDLNNCICVEDRLQLKPFNEAKVRLVSYNSIQSRLKFCLMTFILRKIIELLENDCKITKREIFYQLKFLVKSQNIVNSAISDVSCLLNVGTWDLNIISHRGLIFGSVKLILSSKEEINCKVSGTLIPFDIEDIIEIQSEAHFILIVEKEAIFQKLIDENFQNKLSHPFIIITGKGFPDINTQLFTSKLWKMMKIPVFILVDADPHGILIMLTYRFGSLRNSHVSEHLAVPKAKWLGVFPSEISKLGMNCMEMTKMEVNLVKKMMTSPTLENHPKIIQELSILLKKNMKTSIEGLLKVDTFLSKTYLPNKFLNHDFI